MKIVCRQKPGLQSLKQKAPKSEVPVLTLSHCGTGGQTRDRASCSGTISPAYRTCQSPALHLLCFPAQISGCYLALSLLNLGCAHCTDHPSAGQYQCDAARQGCAVGHTTRSCWICPTPPSPLTYPAQRRPNGLNSHQNTTSHDSEAAAVWKKHCKTQSCHSPRLFTASKTHPGFRRKSSEG